MGGSSRQPDLPPPEGPWPDTGVKTASGCGRMEAAVRVVFIVAVHYGCSKGRNCCRSLWLLQRSQLLPFIMAAPKVAGAGVGRRQVEARSVRPAQSIRLAHCSQVKQIRHLSRVKPPRFAVNPTPIIID